MNKLQFTQEDLVTLSKYIDGRNDSVANLLNKFGGDIDKLKAYVKWLYKYGGTGSKGNGGEGGGGTSNKWSISALLNNDPIISVMPITKTNSNAYSLTIRLARAGSDSYTVSVSYKYKNPLSGKEETITYNKLSMNAEDNVKTISLTNITENGTLTIYALNNYDNSDYTIKSEFILNHGNLSMALVDNNNNIQVLQNEILYYENINITNGLNLRVNHELFLSDADNITLTIDINGNPISDPIKLNKFAYNDDNTHFTTVNLIQLLEINDSPDNADKVAGSYSVQAVLKYTYNNTPFSIPELYNLTIIPNGLFLKIVPTAANSRIYKNSMVVTSEEESILPDNIYKFNTNNVNLYITAFSELNEFLTLSVYKIKKENSTEVKEQVLSQTWKNLESNNVPILCSRSETNDFAENIFEFSLKYNNSTEAPYTVRYYIYTDKDTGEIKWFPSDWFGTELIEGLILKQAYMRMSSDGKWNLMAPIGSEGNHHIKDDVLYKLNNNFGSQGYVTFNYVSNINNANSDYITIYNENENSNSLSSMMISIGIQYSIVNENKPIFDFEFGAGINSNTLVIYQDKIVFKNSANQTNSYEIFIPKATSFEPGTKTKYHLINVLINKTICEITETGSETNKKTAYEAIVYIDGCMEKILTSYFLDSTISNPKVFKLTSIKAHEGNYAVNLLDVTYFNDSIIETYNMDIAASNYWMKYKTESGLTELDSLEVKNYNILLKEILPYFKEENLTIPEQEDDVIINKISPAIVFNGDLTSKLFGENGTYSYGVPIMIVHFNLNDQNTEEGVKTFMKNFCAHYDEGKLNTFGTKSVTNITWIDESNNITTTSGVSFEFALQGSSTGMYKSKNFDLTALSTEDNYTTLWTPNFSTEKVETTLRNEKVNLTYLPENTYTLKADAVDSTHSNNTSIGLFVNKNTKKFSYAVKGQDSSCEQYVKSCLIGFKVLVFFEFTINIGETSTNKSYFAGIYNFNLGRKSYMNLGYYNIKTVLDNLETLDGERINLTDSQHQGFGVYRVLTGKYQPIEGLNVAEIQGGETYFDFSQYDSSILFGNSKREMMFGDFYPTNDTRENLNKIQKFVESVSTYGGGLFTMLGKYMSDNQERDNYGYAMGYSSYKITNNNMHYITQSINQVPNYRWQFKLDEDTNKVVFDRYENITNTMKDPNQTGFQAYFEQFIGYEKGEDEGPNYYNTANASTASYLLDYTSLVEYYTICMALGLVDSVMKNLNIKAFGMQSPFYIAFYDMDTALGRDNGGIYTSPFAFSDYWTTSEDTANNMIFRDFYPDKKYQSDTHPAHNYVDNIVDREITDKVPRGYDIPSSYLFAIAKYAKIFFTSVEKDLYDTNPNLLWYKLRCGSGEIGETTSTNVPLWNADRFVNNYFKYDSNKIDNMIWNLNYRFKYVKKSTSTFDKTNCQVLHGKGIESLKDWLSKRLHILDAYFNIKEDNTNPIQKYNINDDIWENIRINNNLIYWPNFKQVEGTSESNYSCKGNSDVQLEKSIFGSSAQKYTGSSVTAIIKTLDYSPMYFNIASHPWSFICVDKDTTYRFYTNSISAGQGQLTMWFGGSVNWRWVENLDSFVEDNALTINSTYLENITIKNAVLNSLVLETISSLNKIEITSQSATCLIDITNESGVDKCPNLKSIDVHNSKCNIQLNNVNLKTIDCSNMNNIESANPTNVQIWLQDCKYLTDVNVSNSVIDILNCTNMWQGKPTTGITVFGREFANKQLQLVEIKDTNIRELSLTNIQHENMALIISNNGTLSNLSLSGFEYVYITGCKNLVNINIQDGTSDSDKFKLKSLVIANSYPTIINGNKEIIDKTTPITWTLNGQMSNFNNGVTGILDLSKFNYLQTISFSDIWYINDLILPEHDITFLNNAFRRTNLYHIGYKNAEGQYIGSKNTEGQYIDFIDPDNQPIITLEQISLDQSEQTGIFEDSCISLKSFYIKDNTITIAEYSLRFKISDYTTSLASLFKLNYDITNSNTVIGYTKTPNIEYRQCCLFLQELENIDNVTSLANMFYGQDKIILSYNTETGKVVEGANHELGKINELSGLNKILLGRYKNVTDISGMFRATNLLFFNPDIFSNSDGTIGSNKQDSLINITNFALPKIASSEAFISIVEGTFDVLYNRYELFYADTYERQTTRTKHIYSIYIITSENYVSLRRLFAPNGKKFPSALKKIQGFNIINNKVSFDLLEDTDTNVNIEEIKFCFNFNGTQANNINTPNNLGLKYAHKLVLLYKAFNINGNTNKRIDICNFIDFTNAELPQEIPSRLNKIYSNIDNIFAESGVANYTNSNPTNIFSFCKTCNYNSEEWFDLWKQLHQANKIDYIFDDCKFIYESSDNDYVDFEIPTGTSSIEYARQLFSNSTVFVKDNETGFRLTNNSLNPLNKATNINNMFYSSVMDNRTQYPIPENIINFSGSHIKNAVAMFASIKLIAADGYTSYDNGSGTIKKTGYYRETVPGEQGYQQPYNYKLYGKHYKDYLNTIHGQIDAYPILPPEIFKNSEVTNVSNFIASSPLEGYLPDNLYTYTNISNISNIIYRCKVLPTLIKTADIDETTASNIYGTTAGNKLNIYAFVPENYINPKITTINGLISFKLLAMFGVSIPRQAEIENYTIDNITYQQRLYIFSNNSFDEGDYRINPVDNICPYINLTDIGVDDFGESLISGCIKYNKDDETYIPISYDPNISSISDNDKKSYIKIRSMINAYVNITDGNIFEGLDTANTTANIVLGSLPAFISPTMATMYYGYLVKHGTILTLSNLPAIVGVWQNSYIYTGNSTITLPSHNKISDKMILPQINITDYIDTLENYIPSDRRLKNNEYKNGQFLIRFYNDPTYNQNTESISININQIDGFESYNINDIKNIDNNIITNNNLANVVINYYLIFNSWYSWNIGTGLEDEIPYSLRTNPTISMFAKLGASSENKALLPLVKEYTVDDETRQTTLGNRYTYSVNRYGNIVDFKFAE